MIHVHGTFHIIVLIWADLVIKYGQKFKKAVVNHKGNIGFYRVVEIKTKSLRDTVNVYPNTLLVVEYCKGEMIQRIILSLDEDSGEILVEKVEEKRYTVYL